jgi:hypothetical protein
MNYDTISQSLYCKFSLGSSSWEWNSDVIQSEDTGVLFFVIPSCLTSSVGHESGRAYETVPAPGLETAPDSTSLDACFSIPLDYQDTYDGTCVEV